MAGLALILLWAAGTARAATVPIDALAPIGDERIVFPPHSSSDERQPDVAAGTVGDVNADGIEDTWVLIDRAYPSHRESAWINFSAPLLPSTSAAGLLPWRGMQIVGDGLWFGVAGLGDLNGDGAGDLALQRTGSIDVVFGRLAGGVVDLSQLGTGGFRITGVDPGVARGEGTTSRGVLFTNDFVASAGDQNGDGREDLMFRDGRDVKVAFMPQSAPPAPLDADYLGAGGYTLDTASSSSEDPFFDTLGDLNDDGRRDHLVLWSDRTTGAAYASGVVAPPPGTTTDLTGVAEARTGFELISEQTILERGISIGDQNADDRREVGFIGWNPEPYRDSHMLLAYSPEVGTERTVHPLTPGDGVHIEEVYRSNVIDVGDQDGDDRSDLAFGSYIHFSTRGFGGVPGSAIREGIVPGLVDPGVIGGVSFFSSFGLMVAASIADRNGDGVDELVAVHANPYDDEPPDYRATWMIDTFLSAPVPQPIAVEPPASIGSELEFSATFDTSTGDRSRTLGARGYVALRGGCGETQFFAGEIIDANASSTRVSVAVDPAATGLVAGRSYEYALLLENGRGLVGRTEPASFTYSGPSRSKSSCPDPVNPANSSSQNPTGRILRGTKRGEKLIGTPWADMLDAAGGRDHIRGLAGPDLLGGGGGRDKIVAGPGTDLVGAGSGSDRVFTRDGEEDVLRCGAGIDRVFVDKRDERSGCERVRR
jgi:hypothetical protein